MSANLDRIPVVCGICTYVNCQTDKCYRFTNGVWEVFASMNDEISGAAGVIYNKKLHVFGGYGFGGVFGRLRTSKTISVDGSVNNGPDLPMAVYGHAMTSINHTVSLLSGGATTANFASVQTWYCNHRRACGFQNLVRTPV